jgi:peptide deformylase
MMIREVVVYPDRRLKQVSKEVVAFDTTLHTLLDDMYETMIAQNGIGLAAIQVGVDSRVLIITLPDENEEQHQENTLEMVNPIIVTQEGTTKCQEGCLSVPGFHEDVERFSYVKVTYQDREGNPHTLESDDFLAIAIQHEMDHLEGKLFVEKLSILKRKKFEKEWKKRHKKAV